MKIPSPRPASSKHQHPASSSTLQDLLARFAPGKSNPSFVLDILISHCNHQHSSKDKSTSFKTRAERARFLRRFLRELHTEVGYKILPDPRNIGQKHIQATVDLWKKRQLAPATMQTYLSFLRSLALWLGKPGLVRPPAFYGLEPEQYERTGAAQSDKSWSGHAIDIEAMLARIDAYDPWIGAALHLIRALGLRRKEAVMFNPAAAVISFSATGLPPEQRQADMYAAVLRGSKGGRLRYLPLDTPERLQAVEHARGLVRANGDLTRPGLSLKQTLTRFNYVMLKFGLTQAALGATGHGLRHQVLLDTYEQRTGHSAPVRGGAPTSGPNEARARQHVAELAGHGRQRASCAYLGALRPRQSAISNEGNGPTGAAQCKPTTMPELTVSMNRKRREL